MSTSLTLTGAIPGLLRRGSPVNVRIGHVDEPGVYTMPDDRKPAMRHGPHIVAPVDEWSEDYDGNGAMARSCRDDELTLDLTDPTGRFHAILWLRERGHDLRWAENEPEVLAWSVLSVARGGEPINGILRVWAEESSNSAALAAEYALRNEDGTLTLPPLPELE